MGHHREEKLNLKSVGWGLAKPKEKTKGLVLIIWDGMTYLMNLFVKTTSLIGPLLSFK